MISLTQIESDLTTAMKAKDPVAVDTLRGLKVRIQNEKIAKQRDLEEAELVALVKSEIKRRKEAAESFSGGGRTEAAEKELQEAKILEAYMPAQMSEQQVAELVGQVITELSATPADFGKVMGQLKTRVGNQADGAVLARLVKEKLK